jgi:hypothetical protein
MTSGWILPKPPGPLWLFIIWGFEYFKRCAPEPNRFLMCRIQMDVSRRAGQGGFHNGGRCPFPGSKISSSLLYVWGNVEHAPQWYLSRDRDPEAKKLSGQKKGYPKAGVTKGFFQRMLSISNSRVGIRNPNAKPECNPSQST